MKVPKNSGEAGRLLVESVRSKYQLMPHEEHLLVQAGAVADHIAALDAVVAAEGVTAASSQGVRAHPALVEGRAQRIVLTRILAAIGLPADDVAAGPQSQIRGARGARGVYAPRSS